jgi:3-hydroxymyristoyl/3-hydroxydecanoyl-(acyl carrier protein) dehydratase
MDRFSFLQNLPFYFFIDDYSSPKITTDLQQNLNRLFMQRTSSCFFKLSTESTVSYMRSDIDAMRQPNGTLCRSAVKNILPYGEAFLFVDTVNQLTENSALANYTIPTDSKMINAHFVHTTIMPGVLLGEALAQVGILLLHYHAQFTEPTDILVSSIRMMRFNSPALPGETLTQSIKVKSSNSIGARLEGFSTVIDREIFKTSFDVTFVNRDEMVSIVEHIQTDHSHISV